MAYLTDPTYLRDDAGVSRARLEHELMCHLQAEARRRYNAAHRARELLTSHLNPLQRDQFRRSGAFVVHRDGIMYRIGTTDAVDLVYSSDQYAHCIVSMVHDIPGYDVALARKLWLEYDHDGFRRTCVSQPARCRIDPETAQLLSPHSDPFYFRR